MIVDVLLRGFVEVVAQLVWEDDQIFLVQILWEVEIETLAPVPDRTAALQRDARFLDDLHTHRISKTILRHLRIKAALHTS